MAQKINSSMFCSRHGNSYHNNSFLIQSPFWRYIMGAIGMAHFC